MSADPSPSNTSTAQNAYLRTTVLTAPPEQLRLLLLDGALKFCRQGIESLESKNWEGVYTGFSNCRNIVLELAHSAKPDADPELVRKMQSLYMFIFQTIVDASFQKDASKAREAEKLLEYERETWVMAMEKAAKERGSGETSPAAAPPQRSTQNASPRPALSVQG